MGVFGSIVIGLYIVTSPTTLFQTTAILQESVWLAILFFLGLYIVRPILAWPISIISLTLGYLYGPLILPLALAGTILTTLLPYALARYFGHSAGILARIGAAGVQLRNMTGDLRSVIAVRLAPLPTDPVSYTLGLASVPLRPYVIGTILGEAPWVLSAVLIGASANQLTTDGLSADPLLLGTTFAVAALLLLAGPAYRRLKIHSPDLWASK